MPKLGIIPLKKLEKSRPPLEDLPMLIYGLPGAGKTSFCNGDPNSITIAAEPGADFVDTRAVPVYTWEKFQDFVDELRISLQADNNFSSGVVIDIVDNLFEMCRDYTCRQLGISYPGEKKDFGKSWHEVSKEWRLWLASLSMCSSIRYITHMTERSIDRKNEHGLMETINQLVPRFNSGQGAKFLDGICQLVGFMYINKSGQHCITFKPHSTLVVKDRTGLLGDLDEIILPSDPSKGFEHVSNLYKEQAEKKGFVIRPRRKICPN